MTPISQLYRRGYIPPTILEDPVPETPENLHSVKTRSSPEPEEVLEEPTQFSSPAEIIRPSAPAPEKPLFSHCFVDSLILSSIPTTPKKVDEFLEMVFEEAGGIIFLGEENSSFTYQHAENFVCSLNFIQSDQVDEYAIDTSWFTLQRQGIAQMPKRIGHYLCISRPESDRDNASALVSLVGLALKLKAPVIQSASEKRAAILAVCIEVWRKMPLRPETSTKELIEETIKQLDGERDGVPIDSDEDRTLIADTIQILVEEQLEEEVADAPSNDEVDGH